MTNDIQDSKSELQKKLKEELEKAWFNPFAHILDVLSE